MPTYKILSAIGLSLALSGCLNSDDDSILDRGDCDTNNPNMAIQTSVYGNASAVAIGCARDATLTDGYLIDTINTDYSVSTGSNSFYHIGRSGNDKITKYDFLTPSIEEWTYSTNDIDETTSNPYKLVEISDTKAYIIRYNKSKVWIVNPSALNADDYKIGELDLSAYLVSSDTTTSTATDMNDAVVSNGKLFIAMQRLRNGSKNGAYDNYDYTNTSMIAVFDIDTDIEIDTTPEDEGNLKGIILSGHNVQSLNTFNNTIYAASRGDYWQDFGELEAIDTTDYSVKTIVNGSGDIGAIVDAAILSPSKGFILADLSGYVGSVYTYKHKVFQFNPSTNQTSNSLTDFDDTHLSDIEAGPDGYLWIASAVNESPGIYKVDTSGIEENIFLGTNLNPNKISFKN